MTSTIYHFSCPGRVLYLVEGPYSKYWCNFCGLPGEGIRYRCDATRSTTFDLHPVCATCQIDSTIFVPPNHTMAVILSPEAHETRTCDICRQRITGAHYRDQPADFDAHPTCAKATTVTSPASTRSVVVQNNSSGSQQYSVPQYSSALPAIDLHTVATSVKLLNQTYRLGKNVVEMFSNLSKDDDHVHDKDDHDYDDA